MRMLSGVLVVTLVAVFAVLVMVLLATAAGSVVPGEGNSARRSPTSEAAASVSSSPTSERAAEAPTPRPTLQPAPTDTALPEPTRTPVPPPPEPTRTPVPPPPTTVPPTATRMPPTPVPTIAPAPPAQVAANFSGRWRVVDVVTQGAGTGQTFTFDITLAQNGASLTGGNSGLIVSGVVEGETAHVTYVQPALGYTGTFTWTMQGPSTAQGSFTNSSPNSGTSTLQRIS